MNIYQASVNYETACDAQYLAQIELVEEMRISYRAGMSIVELARISGFSRPTVMKYVQNVTTATVEA